MTETIYLLQVYTYEPDKIYKLGRTSRPFELRYNEYKHTKPAIKLVITCDDSNTKETNLLIKFREKFTQRKDLGNEYFIGDVEEMKNIIITYITNNTTIITHKDNTISDKDNTISDKEKPNEEKPKFYRYECYKIYVTSMRIRTVCEKHENNTQIKCLLGHNICDECYKDTHNCIYCDCYDVMSHCEHNKIHDEVPLPDVIIYGKCLELNSLYGTNLRTLLDWKQSNIDNFQMRHEDNTYMSINEWFICGNHDSITPLYADCIHESMMLIRPDKPNDGKLYEFLPLGIKVYLHSISSEDKYTWLTKLNHCYARLLINLSSGKHIQFIVNTCSGGNYLKKYFTLCGCVGDEYVVWVMYKMANMIFDDKIKLPTTKMSIIDANKSNMFQNKCFLEDEDFLHIGMMSFGCANGCPCDWFIKFIKEN